MSFPTTDPEAIRAVLAERLQSVVPKLEWQREAGWVYQPDAEIAGGGTLRNFDLIFEPEVEVTVDERGVQGAYGGGIEYACDVELRVSYPVPEAQRPRFLGSDARDVTALLETLHEHVPGMFAQAWSVSERVATSWTGSPGAYIGSLRFSIRFFASDTVEVAS